MTNSISTTLSIVSPVFLAEQSIKELYKQILSAVEPLKINFEIVLAEDGSSDNSWDVINSICNNDKRVKAIKLSRNFGQHAAIAAAINKSKGKFVVVLDCDLQHDPKYIPDLLNEARKGYDIVYTKVRHRNHSFFRNVSASIYYRILSILIGGQKKINIESNNYFLASRKVINSFLKIKDAHRHSLLTLDWLGFKSSYIHVNHRDRCYGKSSYNFKKLLRHASDGIVSQSNRLLSIGISVGFITCLLAFLASIFMIVAYFRGNFYIPGWTSIIVLMLLCTGIILITMGITGLYIGKMFDQVKERPLFIVDETLNLDT